MFSALPPQSTQTISAEQLSLVLRALSDKNFEDLARTAPANSFVVFDQFVFAARSSRLDCCYLVYDQSINKIFTGYLVVTEVFNRYREFQLSMFEKFQFAPCPVQRLSQYSQKQQKTLALFDYLEPVPSFTDNEKYFMFAQLMPMRSTFDVAKSTFVRSESGQILLQFSASVSANSETMHAQFHHLFLNRHPLKLVMDFAKHIESDEQLSQFLRVAHEFIVKRKPQLTTQFGSEVDAFVARIQRQNVQMTDSVGFSLRGQRTVALLINVFRQISAHYAETAGVGEAAAAEKTVVQELKNVDGFVEELYGVWEGMTV